MLALATGALSAPAQTLLPNHWVTNGSVNAVVRSGNIVYVGGTFSAVGPASGPVNIPRNNLAAFDAASGSALDWNPNAGSSVHSLALLGSKVYVAGDFLTMGGQPRSRVAALDAITGSLDSWDPNANGTVRVLVAGASTIYAGGIFTSIGAQTRTYLAELDAVTGAATSFGPPAPANSSVRGMALNGTTLYVVGDFTGFGSTTRSRIAALDAATGALLPWNPSANNQVWCVATDGVTVRVGGAFTMINNSQARGRLAAFDIATGTLLAWNPEADGTVRTLASLGSTVYAGGFFNTFGGQPRSGLAAVDAGSNVALDWDPQPDAAVHTLHVNGHVYAGGGFSTIGASPVGGIAAFSHAVVAAEPAIAAGGSRILMARPNPVRDSSLIRYELAAAGNTALEVFDVAGRRRAVVERRWRDAGVHETRLSRSDLPSGVYFARLATAGGTHSSRLVVQ
jgi:hypothetical protein